tara:strand:+ start:19595 stop:22972 length:3378 start_codon:yes stop_codon:yes gene_type:complete
MAKSSPYSTNLDDILAEELAEFEEYFLEAQNSKTAPDPNDPTVQLRAGLALAKIENQDVVIANLDEQKKEAIRSLSNEYKSVQLFGLTEARLDAYKKIKSLIEHYNNGNIQKYLNADDRVQALQYLDMLKRAGINERDFDGDKAALLSFLNPDFYNIKDIYNLTTFSAGAQITRAKEFTQSLERLPANLAWAFPQGPDESYDSSNAPSPGGGIYEFIFHTERLFNIGDKFTKADIENIEYLRLFRKEVIDSTGTLQKYVKWVEGRLIERKNVKDRIKDVAGISKGTDPEELEPAEVDTEPSTEEIERERRFQDQCFLTNNFDKIFNSTDIGKTSYSNFVSVQGEPFIATNNLTFHKGQRAFADLTSLEMSMLLPRIKLSKVFYDIYGQLSELKTIPFKFGTHSDFKDPSMLTMGKRERGDDAGIESFSFSFEGQDYATAEKILVCNATYFFKSMSDFIAEFNISNKKLSYSDLAAYPAGNEPFAIKAEVGWQTPDDLTSIVGDIRAKEISKAAKSAKLSIFLTITSFNYEVNEDGSLKVFAEYRGWINDLLSGLKFDIFLNPDTDDGYQEHKIKIAEYLVDCLANRAEKGKQTLKQMFNLQDGTVATGLDLDVNVSLVDNTVIFKEYLLQIIRNAGNDKVKEEAVFGQIDNQEDIGFIEYINRFDTAQSSNEQTKKDFRQKLVDEASRKVNEIKQEGMLINHDGLLEEVFKENWVYKAVIPPESVAHYQRKNVNRKLSVSSRGVPKIKDKNVTEFSVESIDIGRKNRLADNLISQTNKAFRNRAKRQNNDRDFPAAGGPEGRFDGGYTIYFVTLGSILDVVMKRVYSGRSTTKSRFLEKFNLIVGSANTETGPFGREDISIADIPVSMDLFTYWYLTEVMEKGIVTYDIGRFIENMLDKLILPALGADCQESAEVSDLYTIKGQVYNTAAEIKNKETGVALKRGDRVNADSIETKSGSGAYTLKNTNSYYYIFMDSRTALKGSEKYKSEEEAGRIMVLGTGYNKGLTKSIKFKGNDIPYFQEAADATLNDKSGDSKVRRMLKFHSAEIDLFGNTIFYPGMVVLIKPNFPGIRKPFGNPTGGIVTPKIIASTLGIGGYYVVTKVRSSIDPSGGFQTTLDADYEAGV